MPVYKLYGLTDEEDEIVEDAPQPRGRSLVEQVAGGTIP